MLQEAKKFQGTQINLSVLLENLNTESLESNCRISWKT